MFLSREQRLDLLMEMKKKELSMTEVSKEVGISTSLLSQYINNKCQMSSDNIERVVDYIRNQKEYQMIRVPLQGDWN